MKFSYAVFAPEALSPKCILSPRQWEPGSWKNKRKSPLLWQTAGELFALNSSLPLVYLYMLTPQLNLSDPPRGHRCVAKWGPGGAVENIAIRTSHVDPTAASGERDTFEKESKWAKESCRLRPEDGDFSWWRQECKKKKTVCVLLSSLLLWHTFDL